ncbi:phage antirepressor KilAC domain-containing protein [Acinetobacter baumannii]
MANTDGTYTIRECAKTINIGERKLISLLIDKNGFIEKSMDVYNRTQQNERQEYLSIAHHQ